MPTMFHFCMQCEARTRAAELAPGSLCVGCHDAWTAAIASLSSSVVAPTQPVHARRSDGTTLDPCPVCGITQAEHWHCANCTSRGHITGRGRVHSELCGWCEAERLHVQRRAA